MNNDKEHKEGCHHSGNSHVKTDFPVICRCMCTCFIEQTPVKPWQQRMSDAFKNEFYLDGVTYKGARYVINWWLAQIASRDKEVIAEERKRLGEKIVGMKQIETPMWEWDEGYNQAIDNVLSLIEKE